MTGADHQSRHLLGAGSEGRIYSIASPLPPIANKKALTLANQGFLFGAGEMNRTPDLLITNSSTNCFQLLPIAVFTLDNVILAARNNRDLCRNLAATVT